MEDLFECFFTCKVCGEMHHAFSVRYREAGEDIVDWLNAAVRPEMGIAHRAAQPNCPAERADLELPISDASGIGMRIMQ